MRSFWIYVMNVNAISLYAPKNNYNIHYGSKNKSTELPYNMLLQNKDLAKPENYKAYYGVTFKGYKCNPSNFQIKKAYGLECPCCGQMMITEAQIDAFKLRAKNKTGDELKEELLRYYEYYRPNESSIVDIIIEGAEKDEDADLQTIVKNQAQNSKRILEAEQKIVLSDIKRRAVYLTKGRRDKIMDAVDNAFELIEDSNDNFFFKNKEYEQRSEK